MKKLVSLLLSVGLFLSLAAPAAAVNETAEKTITYRGISIFLDGAEIIPADQSGKATEPFIMEGSTYLPLRAVAGALGLDAEWLSESSTVVLTSGAEVRRGSGQTAASHSSQKAKLSYRDISIKLDGESLELKNAAGESVEPFIMGGSVYLPLRSTGEALGLKVDWDSKTSTVNLLSPGVSMERVVETRALDPEGDEVLATKVTLTYSHPDRVHTIVYEGSGTKTERIVYHDADGTPTEAVFYGSDGEISAKEIWEREGDYLHYRHDELFDDSADLYIRYYYRDGRLHSAREYGGSTLSKVHSTDHDYKYDEAGNLIRHYIHIPDASWEEILYSYDKAGNLLRTEGEAYDIHTNGFSRYYIQYYYNDGVLVRSEGTEGSTDYFYTPDGGLQKTVLARYDGSFVITEYSFQ